MSHVRHRPRVTQHHVNLQLPKVNKKAGGPNPVIVWQENLVASMIFLIKKKILATKKQLIKYQLKAGRKGTEM